MSEQQYTEVYKTRLTELSKIPSGKLFAVLCKRPEWVRDAVIKSLLRVNS